MPVVVALAPAVGLSWLAGSLVHQAVAILCCLMVAKAILPAWRRHRDRWVLACAAAGVGLLIAAAFVLPDPCCEPTSVFGWFGLPILGVADLQRWLGDDLARRVLWVQPYLTPMGGAMLIVAHLMNLDLVRRAQHHRCDSSLPVPARA